ncbi:MAG: DUF4422 domain-containing protein [Cytophagales bacterium]|nr:DUF4422 domain-containing protein [Cytophagales bacterium]MDW8383210.1 DUF4422 domain-containing protein [Flammeovirgaceae bacterium]
MNQTNKIKIYVAYHKNFPRPQHEYFVPIHVGKKNSEADLGILGDDTGENISEKNPIYCEQTAYYWAWKNDKSFEYIGLSHYRRFFKFDGGKQSVYEITPTQIQMVTRNIEKLPTLLKQYDVILPRKRVLFSSVKKDFRDCHIPEDWDIMMQILKELHPSYFAHVREVFELSNQYNCYNMMITRRDIFEQYMNWLFPMLEEFEKRAYISQYPNQRRVIGYLSERLTHLFMYVNRFKKLELPVYFVVESDTLPEVPLKKLFLRKLQLFYFRYIWKHLVKFNPS